MPSASARQGERHRVTKLTHTVRMLTHHERCGSVQIASPPEGVPFQNPSRPSLPLLRAQPWQQDTQERGDEEEKVKREGGETVKLLTEGHTPHWRRCSSMIPLFFPPSLCLSLSLLLLCVSANQHRRVLLVTVAAMKEALGSAVAWQPFQSTPEQ